jgi:hypothetical protein
MSLTYLQRSAWTDRPSKGPTHLNVTGVLGTALHYPGMGNRRLFAQDDVARALRGWQDYHMDGRGWSDIAYQVAVDQAGRVWTLRGLTTRSGANGDEEANLEYGALLLVVGDDEAPTGALINSTRQVVADFRRLYPKATAIKPHSAVRPSGTKCPGDRVRALIAARQFEPTTPKDDDMTPEQAARVIELLESIDLRLNGMNARVGVLANNMAPNVDRIADKYVGPN